MRRLMLQFHKNTYTHMLRVWGVQILLSLIFFFYYLLLRLLSTIYCYLLRLLSNMFSHALTHRWEVCIYLCSPFKTCDIPFFWISHAHIHMSKVRRYVCSPFKICYILTHNMICIHDVPSNMIHTHTCYILTHNMMHTG